MRSSRTPLPVWTTKINRWIHRSRSDEVENPKLSNKKAMKNLWRSDEVASENPSQSQSRKAILAAVLSIPTKKIRTRRRMTMINRCDLKKRVNEVGKRCRGHLHRQTRWTRWKWRCL
uniref:(northern house mosquito) hypothetical protein n=1 Tax=Culex pipiens TaxID=7175 RepID=A0A8D8ACP8_CULPI